MAGEATFRFFARLAKLPAKGAGNGSIPYRFNGRPAVKDSIEALGVPHTEVDLILVGGRSVGFDYYLQDADAVEVYPFGSAPECRQLQHLTPPLPERVAFILDVHLGKLARRLRMLGFDCRYRNDYEDPQIVALALREGRIILTRDRGILKHARVTQGYLVGSERAEEQLREVLARYRLHKQVRPFCRCPLCNGLLAAVDKEEVLPRLPEKTARYCHNYQRCADCGQIYWQGAHYQKLADWLEGLRSGRPDEDDGRRN